MNADVATADGNPSALSRMSNELIQRAREIQETNHALHSALTSLKESEANLKVAREEAERANRLKSAFLANMSHEIRTPLGVISGFADIGLQPSQPEEIRINALERIQRNAQHLATIANDILDLAKVEADKFEPEIIQFSANAFFSDIIENASLKAREKGLKFISKHEGEIPKNLTSDPTRLKQILMNIIGNAIKFTSSGEVYLNFRQVAEGKKTYLQFEIIDTGIGLSESQTEGLFEAFVQGDNSMTRKYGGTGLGLMLSRKLARSLGGDVILISTKLGEGSVFQVQVQNYSGELSQMERLTGSANPQEIKPLSGTKVLLVEDQLDNQALIGMYLRMAGAIVEFRENGREGVEAALNHDFDIVILDQQMPIMEGYEAANLLRSHHYTKPMIALTAHAMRGEREDAIAVGFSEFLTKPVDRHLLINTIYQLCVRH